MRYCETKSKSVLNELQELKREKLAQAARAYAKAKAEGTIQLISPYGPHLVASR